MIFIFRRAGSDGARELTQFRDLGFIRLRSQPTDAPRPDRPMDHIRWDRAYRQPDRYSVVCWGESVVQNGRVRLLNNAPLLSKYKQALLLKEKGVATIEVSTVGAAAPVAPLVLPPPIDPAQAIWETVREASEDFLNIPSYSREDVYRAAVNYLRNSAENLYVVLQTAAPEAPLPVPVIPDMSEWLGRLNNHIAGSDLLNAPARPDFYVKKLNLVSEYRVHSFRGVSIRAGKKIPVEGGATHPWVRSSLGGWKISYDGHSVKQKHRDLAHEAVKALGLDFGAVDLGKTSDGDLVVLEVNRAPGLDGGTISQYVKHIKRWDEGKPPVEDE